MLDRIKSMFSSLGSMKIIHPEKNLQKKLHLLTQHLLNSSGREFDAWMELQTQQQLHVALEKVYEAACEEGPYSEEDLCAIFQFYTLLLINCSEELLLCKLVSDDFVIRLCEAQGVSEARMFEAEPYRINLIKAYLGNTTHEAVKYMVTPDRFRVFLQCVRLYEGKTGTVEQTTIANAILNILKKVNELSFLWESIWIEEGLIALYSHCLQRICDQLPAAHSEDLEEIILFVIEVGSSITKPEYQEVIAAFCDAHFQAMLDAIVHIDPRLQIRNICLLMGMFKVHRRHQTIVLFALRHIFEELLLYIIEYSQRLTPIDEQSLMAVFLLNKLVQSPCSHLSDREPPSDLSPIEWQALLTKKKETILLMQKNLQILTAKTLAGSLGDEALQMGYWREFLQAFFHLKLALWPQYEDTGLAICFLEFFEAQTQRYGELLNSPGEWDQLIQSSQEISAKAARDLLQNRDVFEHVKENSLNSALLSFEFVRNFRFMLVETTTLDPKSIKQEKGHHTTFCSVGMGYQPNIMVELGLLSIVASCIVHHNFHQIPALIAEDRECFIVAYKVSEEECKILINLKFTDIENFVFGDSKSVDSKEASEAPRFVRVNLRGSQQIIFEFTNPAVSGTRFKDYLLKSKNNSRERQLTFLNSWLKLYQADTEKSLELLRLRQGQKEGEGL